MKKINKEKINRKRGHHATQLRNLHRRIRKKEKPSVDYKRGNEKKKEFTVEEKTVIKINEKRKRIRPRARIL